MSVASGITKIQKPKSKNYASAALPNPISKHLEVEGGDDLAWLGIPIDTSAGIENIAIAFIVDKTKNVEEQARRILAIFGE